MYNFNFTFQYIRRLRSKPWWKDEIYWKYFFRYWLHYRTNSKWINYINTNPFIYKIADENYSHFLLKIQKTYLSNQFNYPEKLAIFKSQYAFMEQYFPLSLTSHYQQPIILYTFPEFNHEYQLSLGLEARYSKEGQFEICLDYQGIRLYTLTFSIYKHTDKIFTAFIGGLQGGHLEGGGDLTKIKETTKIMYGLRPKQLVLFLIYTLCEKYQINLIQATSNETHFYHHKKTRRCRVKSDLNEFWSEMGGVFDQRKHFILPTALPVKDLEDIPSKKRSLYKKRYELMHNIKTSSFSQLP